MRFALIAAIFTFVGCAGSYEVPSMNVCGFQVEFEQEVTGSEKEFGIYAARFLIARFLADHHSLEPLTISISHRLKIWESYDVVIDLGFTSFVVQGCYPAALGFYIENEQKVRTIAGRHDTLPALYHEFCHSMFAKRDVKHEDPRWTKWNARAKELDEELNQKWWKWKESGKLEEADRKLEEANELH